MITLSAMVTGMIVTVSMALFVTAVAVLCVTPLVQAIVERRKPEMPPLPAIMENLGVAIALAGLTFEATGTAAVGVALALLGAWFGSAKSGSRIHPAFDKAVAVAGVIGVGVLAEYYYVIG